MGAKLAARAKPLPPLSADGLTASCLNDSLGVWTSALQTTKPKPTSPKPLAALMVPSASSVFCAEPGGLNRFRKGIVDALLAGCIPIVFVRKTVFAKLWPHHLFGWRHALVNVSPKRMMRTDFNLLAHLRTNFNASRVAIMQRAIAANVQRVAYLEDASYSGDDALDVALKGMAYGLPG